MTPPVGIFEILIAVIIPLAILGGLYLLFRLACKFSVLTSVALAMVLSTIPMILSHRLLYRGHFYVGKLVLLFPVIGGVILIVQFIRWVAGGSQNTGGVVTSDERQKTLRMVDEGKITSQEASELLDALGRSSAMRGQDRFSRVDMMTLAGIGLVVLGFFLPWVRIQINLPGLLGTSGYQAGYHAGAIGWAVLIISILAALPVFLTPKDYLYKMSLLQIFLLILGVVITISLLVQGNAAVYSDPNVKQVALGLFFCLAGFIVAALASLIKFKNLAA